jgi:hypothetical protein
MAVSRIDFRGADSLVGDAQSAPTPPRKAESNLSSDAPTQCLDHQLQCNISLIQPMTPNPYEGCQGVSLSGGSVVSAVG